MTVRRRLTLQHKVRTATLQLRRGWVGVIYVDIDNPEIDWTCPHHHRYPDLAYTCAAVQLRRYERLRDALKAVAS